MQVIDMKLSVRKQIKIFESIDYWHFQVLKTIYIFKKFWIQTFTINMLILSNSLNTLFIRLVNQFANLYSLMLTKKIENYMIWYLIMAAHL